ncbi:phosphoribosyltransferase [Oleiagrimonas sp. C23AA]|nr:phosphoribosyltransferase family protein [Oleiagrimonas sp. C23AA]NII11085.1 phosphoribosyltransferase [Oleiagrimonas sp. C23AA]
MPFVNRTHAARFLAAALEKYAGENTLVLAIPRGGVPVGRIVADHLGARLDVVLVRKLGAPGDPEYAVGAIDESGWSYVSPDAEQAGADADYLHEEMQRQMQVLVERNHRYRGARAPEPVHGCTVIVVDDGLATGATMIAALHAARRQHPARLVCAVPVASAGALAAVSPLCDEAVCLATPSAFGGVAQYYLDFPQVGDQEVQNALYGDQSCES